MTRGLALACFLSASVSFAATLHADAIGAFVADSVGIHHVAYGMLGALGFMLLGIVEGRRVAPHEAGMRLIAAGLLGFFGGKLAGGMQANEQMQAAVAGIAGYAGRQRIDQGLDAALERLRGKSG